MSPAANTGSRVLVAVGPASFDTPAFAAAAQLARAIGAELATLFVEDIDLLRLAELPFAFEVGVTLPTARPLVASDVERSFRAQANEFRRVLAEIAGELKLDLTFDVVRGKRSRALFDVSSAQDIIVFAGASGFSFTPHPPTAALRHALRAATTRAQPRRRHAVAVVVLDTGPATRRALAAAHGLAQANAAELTVFLAGDDAQSAELAAMVTNWLKDEGAHARLIPLRESTPEDVAELVIHSRSEMLIWPGDGDAETAAKVEALLAAISCPLIVVR